jgi:hypothetical protein
MTFSFVRRTLRYPRCRMQPSGLRRDPFLVRRVSLRPGRFVLLNPKTGAPDWSAPLEQISSGDVVAPLNPALYLARVDDVTPEGECFVRIWEVPSGLAGTTTLTKEVIGDLPIKPGDTLRVYTWIEVPRKDPDAFDEPRPRIWVEPTPRGPTQAARRAALQEALAALKIELAGSEEGSRE